MPRLYPRILTDPLEAWATPPFEPDIRDGRIYARGATDDKGNLLTPVLAVEALLRTEGRLPINVKFFFEGQEEIYEQYNFDEPWDSPGNRALAETVPKVYRCPNGRLARSVGNQLRDGGRLGLHFRRALGDEGDGYR